MAAKRQAARSKATTTPNKKPSTKRRSSTSANRRGGADFRNLSASAKRAIAALFGDLRENPKAVIEAKDMPDRFLKQMVDLGVVSTGCKIEVIYGCGSCRAYEGCETVCRGNRTKLRCNGRIVWECWSC